MRTDAPFVGHIAAKGSGEDRHFVDHVVQQDADLVISLVGQRPDIHIAALCLAATAYHRVGQLLLAGQLHQQQVGGADEAFDVVIQPEDIELLGLLVPVGADAAEAGRAVVQRVGHHTDLGLFNGHDLALEEGIVGLHGGTWRMVNGELGNWGMVNWGIGEWLMVAALCCCCNS